MIQIKFWYTCLKGNIILCRVTKKLERRKINKKCRGWFDFNSYMLKYLWYQKMSFFINFLTSNKQPKIISILKCNEIHNISLVTVYSQRWNAFLLNNDKRKTGLTCSNFKHCCIRSFSVYLWLGFVCQWNGMVS